MKKSILSLGLALLVVAPAWADNLGSAIGGTAGNQSGMAGGVYLAAPGVLSNGQQAGFAIDPTTHGLITVPVTSGPSEPVKIDQTTPGTTNGVTPLPSATTGWTTQSCTVACASTIVSGAHSLGNLEVSATVTGWLLIYDATSCSANGTVTPKKAFAYAVANATLGVSWADIPMVNTTGIAACFSSTGPYTATASTTAYISLDTK